MENKPPLAVDEMQDQELLDALGIERPGTTLTENKETPKKEENFLPDDKQKGKTPEIIIDEAELLGIEKIGGNKEEETQSAPPIENKEDLDPTEIFSQLGEGLSKLGVIPEPSDKENFVWTQESFIEQLEIAKQTGAEELLKDLVSEIDNGSELFQALFIDKVPVTNFAQYTKAIIEYDNIDVSTPSDNLEKNQRRVVRDYLMSIGHEETEIDDQIEYLADTQKLGATAEKYKAKLIENTTKIRENEIAKAKTLERNRILEKERFLNDMAEEVRAAIKVKEIDGFPVSENEAKELFRYATTPVYKMSGTNQELTEFDKSILEIRKNPKQFLKLAKLVKNGLDIKEAVKKESSRNTDQIFKYVKKSVEGQQAIDPFAEILGGKTKK